MLHCFHINTMSNPFHRRSFWCGDLTLQLEQVGLVSPNSINIQFLVLQYSINTALCKAGAMWDLVGFLLLVLGSLLFKLLLRFCSLECLFPWLIKKDMKIPPGSMGYPIIGETFEFFRPNSSFDIPPFIQKRMLRYGTLFRTSLVGRPVIVSTDPEVNHLIFQQEGRLFQSWYPDTFTQVFGEQNVGSLHGYMYKYLRNMVLTLVGTENLKEKILSEFQDFVSLRMQDWSDKVLDFKDASASILFDFTAMKLISYDANKDSAKTSLRYNFQAFIQGLISFPWALPGTAYHACLQGRRNAMEVLRTTMKERKCNSGEKHGDFFDYVIGEMEKEGSPLTTEIALDLMFVLLFASFETTSLAMTLALRFLADNPHVREELTKESEAILANKADGDSKLTWKDYKSMTFTSYVVSETIRLANIVPGMFRKAMKDVQVKGYTIPAGWAVVVCPTVLHLDPKAYPDPLAFNPWRWKKLDGNNPGKYYIPFGGGMRFCVGTDFTKMAMSVFLHNIATTYRWKSVKGGEIRRTPGLSFPKGYHVHFSPKPH